MSNEWQWATTVLECVFVQLTFGQMFSRKAYARTVRGNVMCIGRLIVTSGRFFRFFDGIPARKIDLDISIK